jgi:hypothetical protein
MNSAKEINIKNYKIDTLIATTVLIATAILAYL